MASILVIDDDRDFRAYVSAVLERSGHDVTSSGSSGLVVRAIHERRLRSIFDAAVVDILMPGVNGHEVIQTLKEALPRTRVVAITGGGSELGVECRLDMAAKLGAEATLAKPFSSHLLCSTVDRALGLAG